MSCRRKRVCFPVTDRYFVYLAPVGVVSVTLYRRHVGDSEFITYWKGRVTGVQLSGAEATLKYVTDCGISAIELSGGHRSDDPAGSRCS